jgi:hypothetical protein
MAAMGDGFRSRRSNFFRWSAAVAIYRLLQNSAFAPEDIAPLVAAYEDCLRTLKLSDRSDPITEIVAKKIIELAQTGIRDSARLGRLALQEIRISGSG